MTGEGAGHSSLPIVLVPHPVGDRDSNVIAQRGADIARECARILTTPAAELTPEFADKRYPLPDAVMPR